MSASEKIASGEVSAVRDQSADLKVEKDKQTSATTHYLDDEISVGQLESDLRITGDDLADAEQVAKNLNLGQVREILTKFLNLHELDPNLPDHVISSMKEFLSNEDVFAHPEKHQTLIHEMKVEAALIQDNSPYVEVRAVVDNTDDPRMPCSTVRAWLIGLLFVIGGAFINQLFDIRQPAILVEANVAQLLAYPLGKLLERTLPDYRVTIFGNEISLNPGPFSKKEHMLITIMANCGFNVPYTNYVVWTQFLKQYFNQAYAGQFGYQILVALATNFVGYGIAGICRRFLVYPTHCVWPTSLVTIALNASFHNDANHSVQGPFRRLFTASRLRCFLYVFIGMFIYFWFPNYIFQALSVFNWMTWIAPGNMNLSTVTGMVNGLGLNPIPTFDWNIVIFDSGNSPLVLPFFNVANAFMGMVLTLPVVLAIWYTNTWSTGYIPINSNRVFDHFGKFYNVSRAIDDRGMFDPHKYAEYSPAFLSAGNLTVYMMFFGIYSATISYAFLYHRREIALGMKNLFKGKRVEYQDVHNRLMAKYPEVSEWWYLAVLLFAVACGCAGIAGWETYTNVGVIFYGIALCLVFVLPVGIIRALTGMEVTLNVLAEFIGGAWVAGNALAMNYFKSFGYVTCAHAIRFSNDLKLAHYIKIPPRHAFWSQIVATLVSTFVCTGVMNFQMRNIPGVCDANQPDKFTCPGINTFFTAAVLWGTLGPHKMFGFKNGQYTWLLIGFPIGFVVPIIVYYARKRFPTVSWVRSIHPVIIFYGGILWAPYNMSYLWPSVPIGYFSMVWLKSRYTAFWSKYNYVVSASLSAAIAISAIVMFFALQFQSISINWWGNSVSNQGCENEACTWKTLSEGEYFGPRVGEFH